LLCYYRHQHYAIVTIFFYHKAVISNSSKKEADSQHPPLEKDATPTLPTSEIENVAAKVIQSTTFGVLWSIITRDSTTVLFLLINFFIAGGMSLVENMLFLFLVEDLGAKKWLCGLSVVVTVAFEIPIFHHGKALLGRLGIQKLLFIAQAAFSVRAFGYTLLKNPFFVLLCEPLHGVTFGCYHIASVEYIRNIAPLGFEATSQGLLGTVRSLGSLVGTCIGGLVMESQGGATMYYIAGVVICMTMFLQVINLHSQQLRTSAALM
jgi:hypothetical protein